MEYICETKSSESAQKKSARSQLSYPIPPHQTTCLNRVNPPCPDANPTHPRCKPTAPKCKPKLNQCKRFVFSAQLPHPLLTH